jgi:hypothetical protein
MSGLLLNCRQTSSDSGRIGSKDGQLNNKKPEGRRNGEEGEQLSIECTTKGEEASLRGAYWSRTWVVQELVLSNKNTHVILLGPDELNWSSFSAWVRSFDNSLSNNALKLLKEELREIQTSFLMNHCNNPARLMSQNKQQQLMGLLQDFGHTKCVDVRDRIFALRMIVDDVDLIEVDYRMSPAELFLASVRRLSTLWQMDASHRQNVTSTFDLPRLFYKALELDPHKFDKKATSLIASPSASQAQDSITMRFRDRGLVQSTWWKKHRLGGFCHCDGCDDS